MWPTWLSGLPRSHCTMPRRPPGDTSTACWTGRQPCAASAMASRADTRPCVHLVSPGFRVGSSLCQWLSAGSTWQGNLSRPASGISSRVHHFQPRARLRSTSIVISSEPSHLAGGWRVAMGLQLPPLQWQLHACSPSRIPTRTNRWHWCGTLVQARHGLPWSRRTLRAQ